METSKPEIKSILLRLSLIEVALQQQPDKKELVQEITQHFHQILQDYFPTGHKTQESLPEEDILQGDQAAADFLKVSKSTIYNYRREGRIPFKKLGHHVFFSKKALIAAMRKG